MPSLMSKLVLSIIMMTREVTIQIRHRVHKGIPSYACVCQKPGTGQANKLNAGLIYSNSRSRRWGTMYGPDTVVTCRCSYHRSRVLKENLGSRDRSRQRRLSNVGR